MSESLSFPCLGWAFMDSFYSAPVCLILYPFVLNGVLSVRASKRGWGMFSLKHRGEARGAKQATILTQEPVECGFSIRRLF